MAARKVPIFLSDGVEERPSVLLADPVLSSEHKHLATESKPSRKRVSRKKQTGDPFPDSSPLAFPYDVNLLKRTYTQWQFGDWGSLIKLNLEAIENHPDRARLALFVSAGYLQTDCVQEGKKFLELAHQWGINKKFACQILAAGLHNNLGRVAAIFGNKNVALKHFESAIEIGGPGDDVRLLAQARMAEQLKLIARATQSLQDFSGLPSTVPAFDKKSIADLLGFLGMLHDLLKPRLYLQLGVTQGMFFEAAKGRAIGVDPLIDDRVSQRDGYFLLASSSDEFFSIHAEHYLDQPLDLVFVDGLPLIEYVIRDFIAVERYGNSRTLVAVPGIYPKSSEQAGRSRSGPDWCGDVWKLPSILQKYRPDLKFIEIDLEPHGLLLVGNLDGNNSVLSDDFFKINDEIESIDFPPDHVVQRQGAQPSDGGAVKQFLNSYFGSEK